MGQGCHGSGMLRVRDVTPIIALPLFLGDRWHRLQPTHPNEPEDGGGDKDVPVLHNELLVGALGEPRGHCGL